MYEVVNKNQTVVNDDVLRALFGTDGLRVHIARDVWEFPSVIGVDGGIGATTVSKCEKVPVEGAESDSLAVHITFNIAGGVVPGLNAIRRGDSLDLTFSNLHFTARPYKSQKIISGSGGSSSLQAQKSIHRGVSNDWSPDEDARWLELMSALGMKGDLASGKEAIRDALSCYSATRLKAIAPRLLGTIKEQLTKNISVPADSRLDAPPVNCYSENWGPTPGGNTA